MKIKPNFRTTFYLGFVILLAGCFGTKQLAPKNKSIYWEKTSTLENSFLGLDTLTLAQDGHVLDLSHLIHDLRISSDPNHHYLAGEILFVMGASEDDIERILDEIGNPQETVFQAEIESLQKWVQALSRNKSKTIFWNVDWKGASSSILNRLSKIAGLVADKKNESAASEIASLLTEYIKRSFAPLSSQQKQTLLDLAFNLLSEFSLGKTQAIWNKLWKVEPLYLAKKIASLSPAKSKEQVPQNIREEIESGEVYFQNRDFLRAIAVFEKRYEKIAKASCDTKREPAKKIIETHKKVFDLDAQLRWLTKLNEECADTQSLEWEGLVYLKQKKDDLAIETFNRAIQKFPKSSLVDEVLYLIARTHLIMGQWEEALKTLDKILTGYPKSEVRSVSAFRKALILFHGRKWKEAVQQFEPLFGDFASEIALGAKYWCALAYLMTGERQNAFALFDNIALTHRDSYYGLLLEEKGLIAPASRNIAGLMYHRFTTDVSVLSKEERSKLWRAEYYLRAGFPQMATHELNQISWQLFFKTSPRFVEYLATLYSFTGDYFKAQLLIDQNKKSTFYLQTAFPQAFGEWMVETTPLQVPSPHLMWAFMRQESAFRPEVISPSDAIGLLQLTLPTASKTMGRPIDSETLLDKARNIEIGKKYVANLLSEFNGEKLLAIAAYNAGEELVAHWRHFLPDIDLELFVELIPYGETRRYTKAVYKNYLVYERLYADNKAAE